MNHLLGFLPDADPTQPGVITDCSALIPSTRGMIGAPSAVVPNAVPALASEARGAAVTMSTTGVRRIFAGTQTRLYELSGSSWADVSRGGNYTGATDNRWSLAQFGNATLATNDVDAMQVSTAGAFADLAGAPKARVVISTPNFVIAFNTVDGTYGDQADRWWCSAFQDHTSWAPSVTTQATTGRLIGEGGEITAAIKFGQQAVAYKARGLFLGSYVGSPVVWQWDQVPGDGGCVGPEAVADIGSGRLLSVGEDNIWLYDGTRANALGVGEVRQWLYDNLSPTYRYRTIVSYDRQANRVWIHFPGKTSTTGQPDMALVYHIETKRWGRHDMTIQAAMQYVAQGTTFDTAVGTYDVPVPSVSFDSQYWLSGGRLASVFNTSNQIVILNGASVSSSFTTGDLGDDDGATMLKRIRLRFISEPSTSTAYGFTKSGEGKPLLAASSASLTDSGYDIRQSARWHQVRFEFTGDFETNGLGVTVVSTGQR